MFLTFLHTLWHYSAEVIPSVAAGFLISGLFHEFVPESIVQKHLAQKGVRPILWATIIGALLPICCFGTLPIAVSLRKRGVPLGPVLAFLVATPATSVSAILVMWALMGFTFTLYMCLAVIILGLIIGIIGNSLSTRPAAATKSECPHCQEEAAGSSCCPEHQVKKFWERLRSVFRFSFIQLPKEIGVELVIGLILAALVASLTPIHQLITHYLAGGWGYAFALVTGLLTYICSTASVPLVHAFIAQGLSVGAGIVLLLVGPITSYGTILVLNKEFGIKILLVYLLVISLASLLFGFLYSFLPI